MNNGEDGVESSGCRIPFTVGDKSRSMPVPVPRLRPVARPRTQGKSASLAPDIQITDMSSTLRGQKPSLPPKPRREPPDPPMSCSSVPKKPSNEEVASVETNVKDYSVDYNSNSESLQNRVPNGAGVQNSGVFAKHRVKSRKRTEDVSSSSDEDSGCFVPGRKTSVPNKLDIDNSDNSARNKPKPLPPKKPLPQLPKHPQDCPSVTSAKKDFSQHVKPPIPSKPSKPAPTKHNPHQTNKAGLQPSIAALASKLAAVPVFPLKLPEDGRMRSAGSSNSPRFSPRPSPASSPRPSPIGSPSFPSKTGHSTTLSVDAHKKENGVANRVFSAKPKITSSRPIKPDSHAKDTVMKQPPARPSPPSADLLARKRSKTAETLEDQEVHRNSPMKAAEPDGPLRKSSNPENGKKRLAQRARSLAPAATARKISSREESQRRTPPPLPACAGFDWKISQNRPPPPIPECPRPRPFSEIVQSSVIQSLNKSISVGDISRFAAKDEAEYTYAYQHTFVSTHNNDSLENSSNNEYTIPEATAVTEFVDSINKKSQSTEESGVYEDVDVLDITPQTEETISADFSSDDSFSDGYDDSNEYIYPTASGESSNSDDSAHDYELPPEDDTLSRPHGRPTDSTDHIEPIHNSPSDSGSSENEQDEVIEDEPLYQVYVSRTLRRERNMSRKSSSSSNVSADMSLDELTQGTLRNMRMLWCELPEIKASGILDTMKSDERKRQEAIFEVITSEASYFKSLNILVSHFMKSADFSPGSPQCLLERGQYHVLFSNVGAIKDVSERFLKCLRERQKEGLVISTISDVIEEHASRYFEVYVKYCSNQIYQDRTLKTLRLKSPRFVETLSKLETKQDSKGLTLQSFLVLPMQRITRLPLLVDAICHRCEPGGKDYLATDKALSAVNKVVYNCNEGARKMERMEEMFLLQGQIEFKTKPLALATSSRYLLRRGELMHVVEDNRSTLKKGKHKMKPIYLFLFSDLVLLSKKKSDNRYQVLDYATRKMSQIGEGTEADRSTQLKHAFSLILLENSEEKTKDFVLLCESETDRTRWMEAFKPSTGGADGETVYESWDCPQIQAIHKYVAQQPDELSLHEGDVINVLRKLPDGWYHGERLCDAVQGWFPANHTEEIRNEHVRARNLLQRYRLLAASNHLIGMTLKR